jgi:chaperonin GroEL
MAKLVIFDDDVREKIVSGSDKLTRIVSKTMGPKGKNVMIGKFVGAPIITKDGVSVAREIVLDDPFEDLVCQLIKEASGRTADIAGDGTTTATVLSDAILKNGLKLLESSVSPIDIREGLNLGLVKLKEFISGKSKKIKNKSEIVSIASISANNDIELGESIADAYEYTGLEGTVSAEANASKKTHVRYIDGMEIKSGYKDSRFLSKESKNVTLENCSILCVNKELSHLDDFIHVLNELHEKNKPLLILAKDINKSALETLVANNSLGKLKSCAVKIPSEMLDDKRFTDLCLMLGTSSEISSKDFKSISVKDLGFAKKVEVSSFVSKIFEANKNKNMIDSRIELYENALKDIVGDNKRLDLISRIGFLKSKAAVLSVGYSTELELREKGDRIDDALWATRAALEDGVVPGGGVTLLRCSKMLRGLSHERYQKVFDALAAALTSPFYKICNNAGKNAKDCEEIVLAKEEFSYGYDAREDRFGDLIDFGVLDPAKVTITAVSNAISIALVLINTESIVVEDPQKPSDWQPPAGWRPPEKNQLNHRY